MELKKKKPQVISFLESNLGETYKTGLFKVIPGTSLVVQRFSSWCGNQDPTFHRATEPASHELENPCTTTKDPVWCDKDPKCCG